VRFTTAFEWDEGKRRQNVAKHGIDFVRAQELFDGRRVLTVPRGGSAGPGDGNVGNPRSAATSHAVVGGDTFDWLAAEGANRDRRINRALRICVEAQKRTRAADSGGESTAAAAE
jgi:hypothetical protein